MQQAGTKSNVVTLEELKERVKNYNAPILINVLGEESFGKLNGLRLPGSHWIPLAELDRKAPFMFPKNQEIVTYCASYECTASDKGAEKLQELGFTNVRVYKGGVKEWKEAGLPMETNQEESQGCCGGSSSCGCG